MKTNILGYPRIGRNRELKKACEAFWAGKIDENDLYEQGRKIRKENWLMMKEAGIDLIPSNDFSFYDNTLDMSLMLGAIPNRYNSLLEDKTSLHFAMARGIQNGQNDIIAMEMTKWFDTNYHYIVPEFSRNQQFSLFDTKAIDEFREAKSIGIITKPVLIGPVSFLLSGKEKEDGFNRLELIDRLLPTYIQIINALEKEGAEWLQIDEPYLALDLDDATKAVFEKAYKAIKDNTRINIILTTYFDGLKENSSLALTLPVKAIHIDLVRCPEQIDDVLNSIPDDKILSLGIVDGRNIWKNDYKESLLFMDKAKAALGSERILIAGSSSFLHVPYDLENETNESVLLPEIKRWMAFARQKVDELALLKDLASDSPSARSKELYDENVSDISSKHSSALVHNASVSQRISLITDAWLHRKSPFLSRSTKQHERLHLPLLPTTTIGSFPQTKEVRSWRLQFKKGEISLQEYEAAEGRDQEVH